jgi:hypothetical protein
VPRACPSSSSFPNASKSASMLPIMLLFCACARYGRWRGPSHALADVEAVMDWGSWPRNGLPDCPANPASLCRLYKTAGGSARVAVRGTAHLRAGSVGLLLAYGRVRRKEWIYEAVVVTQISAVASGPPATIDISLGLPLPRPPSCQPSSTWQWLQAVVHYGIWEAIMLATRLRMSSLFVYKRLDSTIQLRALTCSGTLITCMLHAQPSTQKHSNPPDESSLHMQVSSALDQHIITSR